MVVRAALLRLHISIWRGMVHTAATGNASQHKKIQNAACDICPQLSLGHVSSVSPKYSEFHAFFARAQNAFPAIIFDRNFTVADEYTPVGEFHRACLNLARKKRLAGLRVNLQDVCAPVFNLQSPYFVEIRLEILVGIFVAVDLQLLDDKVLRVYAGGA